jgi:hypothetical protein
MTPRPLVILAAGLLAFAGCGGDSQGGGEPAGDAVAQPEPAQPIETMVEPLNAAVDAGSCEQYVELVTSLAREGNEAGGPPRPGECAVAEKGPLRLLEGARFEDSAEFGTGAIIEGTLGAGDEARPVVTLWVVDRDGRFRVSYAADGAPQLGTEPAPDARPEEAADGFLEAIRAGDCEALKPLLNPDGRLVTTTGGVEAACDAVIDGALFAPALKATPGAEPEPLGATVNYAFFGVPTRDAYFTLLLSNLPDAEAQMTVLDVLPSTPIELQEEAGSGDR